MTEIERIKLLIAESEGVELSNWNGCTLSQREAYARIESNGRNWLISLLTTIESQKETIDEQYHTISTANIWNSKLKDEIESLKAITELAVPVLKKIAEFDKEEGCYTSAAINAVFEIEKLQK